MDTHADQVCSKPDRWPWAIGLLVCLPIALVLVHPTIPFGPLYRDCWLYHGYFVDLPGHLRAFGDLYYSSRLSMTVPGWLTYRVLPPLLANHVLHLGVYLLGVLSLYTVVRHTVNARAALLVSLLLGGHSYFLLAAVSDYFDGYSIGYFLLTLALSTRAAHSDHWRRWLFLTGMSAAALVVVNILLGVLLFPLAVHHVLVNRAGRRQPLDAGGFWIGLGGLTLLGALALFSHLAGGPLFFLSSSFTFAQGFQQNHPTNPFKRPPGEWLPLAGWLVWPAIAASGAVAALVSGWWRAHRHPSALFLWYQVQMLGMLVLLGVMESSRRYCLLQIWFYASALLVPFAFLALAGLWGDWLAALSSRGFTWLTGFALVLPVLLAVVPARPDLVPPVALLAGAGVVAVLLPRLRGGMAAGIVALSLLIGIDAGLRQSFRMEHTQTRQVAENLRLERDQEFADRRDVTFARIHEAMRQVRRLDPCYQALFWFDIDEPLGLMFDNVACMHCWGRRMINNTFPDTSKVHTPLRAGMRLLVLSTDDTMIARVDGALRSRGLRASRLVHRRIGEGPLAFDVHLFETSRDDLTAGPGPRPSRKEVRE